MQYHLAGEPINGVQRCDRCGVTIVDYDGAQMVATDDTRPMFFPSGRLIAHDGPAWAPVEQDADASGIRRSLCALMPGYARPMLHVAALLLMAGLLSAQAPTRPVGVPADVDHYEVGIFREPPIATQGSTPFSRTVITLNLVTCDHRLSDDAPDNVPNPATFAWFQEGDPLKECRVLAPTIVLALPLGVNYRAGLRGISATGAVGAWGFATNTFRRAPRGLPCPNGQPGVMVSGEADLNGKPVQIQLCVNQ